MLRSKLVKDLNDLHVMGIEAVMVMVETFTVAFRGTVVLMEGMVMIADVVLFLSAIFNRNTSLRVEHVGLNNF